MTNDDFDEFSKVVVAFAELKGKELSTPAQKLYFRALKHWSLSEVKRAAEHLLRTCEFMPTPKQFEDLRRAGEPVAAEAWTAALAACVNWRKPEALPTGRIARAAAAVGGFRAIAMADAERDLPFVQKRFLEAYNDLTDVEPVRQALPQIAEHGKRAALSAPTNIAATLPAELTRREPQRAVVALPAPVVAPVAPKVTTPPPSARDKIVKLLPLGYDDEAIAKVAGETVETVRQVRAEQECEA